MLRGCALLMLQISNLAAARNGQRIFRPISLSCSEAGCVEITGENGAGKTTLLRTLAGLHTQFEGAFEIGSRLYQGHRIGLDESLTGLQNLAWYAALADRKDGETDVLEALRRVDMLALAMTPIGRLSQGQQRRIAMARWLLDDAEVWLLDEPLTSLDRRGQNLIVELIEDAITNGTLVVYTTHTSLNISDKQTLDIEAALAEAS